jgi:hypothetical protein
MSPIKEAEVLEYLLSPLKIYFEKIKSNERVGINNELNNALIRMLNTHLTNIDLN